MSVIDREKIEIGMTVEVVLKSDQRAGKLTRGIATKILTQSNNHPHGIKVMLADGRVGHVKEVIE